MRGIALIVSALGSALAGGLVEQMALSWYGLQFIAARCFGVATFAGVLLGCMAVMVLSGREWR